MTLDEIRKLIEAAPNDGDEQDWLDAWRTVGPALLAAVEDMADELQAAKDADPYICKAESVDRLLAALEAIKLP